MPSDKGRGQLYDMVKQSYRVGDTYLCEKKLEWSTRTHGRTRTRRICQFNQLEDEFCDAISQKK